MHTDKDSLIVYIIIEKMHKHHTCTMQIKCTNGSTSSKFSLLIFTTAKITKWVYKELCTQILPLIPRGDDQILPILGGVAHMHFTDESQKLHQVMFSEQSLTALSLCVWLSNSVLTALSCFVSLWFDFVRLFSDQCVVCGLFTQIVTYIFHSFYSQMYVLSTCNTYIK